MPLNGGPLHQSSFGSQQDGVGPTARTQLGEDRTEMRLHGADAHVELPCDRFVAQAIEEQAQNIAFALGERRVRDAVGHSSRRRRADVPDAACNRLHAAQCFVGAATLNQVAVHRSLKGEADLAFSVARSEDHHPGLGHPMAGNRNARLRDLLQSMLIVRHDDVDVGGDVARMNGTALGVRRVDDVDLGIGGENRAQTSRE
jgi:hypothetical protein